MDTAPAFDKMLPIDGVLGALVDQNHKAYLDLAASQYNRLRPGTEVASNAPGIPKKIHQIWLGSKTPRKLLALANTWRSRHPDWEYCLWTDREIDALELEHRDLVDQADCMGQKSDILRAEILYRQGGVYVDLDYENYKNIDLFVERYDFFGTLRNVFAPHLGWPAVWRGPVLACNSFFGSRPGHPVLQDYLKRVRMIWQNQEAYQFRPDELPRTALAAIGGAKKAAHIKRTGVKTYLPYHHATKDYLQAADDRFVLFPPAYFHPLMPGARTLYLMPDFWKRCSEAGIRWPDIRPYTRTTSFTHASHLSKNSWL